MNKKIFVVTILVIGVLATFGVSKVAAYRGDYMAKGPNHTQEREAAMEQIMQEQDYGAWKDLMTENGRTPGVLNKVTSQEDFAKFAQAYELGKEGKAEEANAIRSELGLGNGQGKGGENGKRGANRNGNFVDANGNGTCDRME